MRVTKVGGRVTRVGGRGVEWFLGYERGEGGGLLK